MWVWSYTSDYPAGIDVNVIYALVSANFALANVEEMLPPGIFLHEKHRFHSEDPIFEFNVFIKDYIRRKLRKRHLAAEEIFDNIQRGTLADGARALLKEMDDEKIAKKYERFAEIFDSQQASYREMSDKIISKLIPLDKDGNMPKYDEKEKFEGKEEKLKKKEEGKSEKEKVKKAKGKSFLHSNYNHKLNALSEEEEGNSPLEILRRQRDSKLEKLSKLRDVNIEEIKEKLKLLRKQRKAQFAFQPVKEEENEEVDLMKEEEAKRKEARRLEKEKKNELLERIAKMKRENFPDVGKKSEKRAKSSSGAMERENASDDAPTRKSKKPKD
eukprot:TRINITY_DN6182_c0_g1_i3.p1 TRINITY_DN6182_c0_g1~~TRINITY_DN6182_c0_g1_i3.p1  ORF type:complete len:328 (-),score=123.88 TRINITY_DN6182_c0_g1_i3:140-1123(-)